MSENMQLNQGNSIFGRSTTPGRVHDSLESINLVISSMFQRLSLKDKPISVFEAANKHQIDCL